MQWSVSSLGTFTRKTEASGPLGYDVSITALSPSRAVSAIRLTTNTLEVTSWDVLDGGAVTEKGSLNGRVQVSDARIITAAADRVVTAVRRSDNGNLQVAAWDVVAAGGIDLASSAEAGDVSSFALAPVGTTRVATAVRSAAGTLKLITWEVVDTVKRLYTATGGAFSTASAVNLGWDRIVTPLILNDQSLKLIAWRETSVGVLHARSGPAVIAGPSSTPNGPAGAPAPPEDGIRNTSAPLLGFWQNLTDAASQTASKSTDLVFQPNIEGVDPMITAGRYYLIISQQGRLGFFSKLGSPLSSKNGEKTNLMTAELFSPLWKPTTDSGAVNRNNINLHLRLPLTAHPEMQCDATATSPVDPCMEEIYDTRVAHDPYTNRFVIIAAVRNRIWMGDTASDGTLLDPVVRRYVAIAISRTEDPRDGFEQYMMTEPNYSDWPRMGISNGVLTLAHNAPKNVTDWKPMAYTFSIADLSAGKAEPRNWKVDPWEIGSGKMVPVIHFGDSSGWTHIVRPNGTLWEVYPIKDDGDLWDTVPTFVKTSVDIGAELLGFREGIVYRNSRFHAACVRSMEPRVVDSSPEQFSVRLLRFALLFTGGVPSSISKSVQMGYIDQTVGHHAPGDAATDEFSYEMPSLAVNAAGDILVVFGRVPVNNSKPQEARYLIYDNSDSTLRSSRELQAGETLLTTTYSDATVATPLQYYRMLWDSSDKDYIDYANAVVDPSDDLTFWMTHEFASSTTGKLKMVVGSIQPF